MLYVAGSQASGNGSSGDMVTADWQASVACGAAYGAGTATDGMLQT